MASRNDIIREILREGKRRYGNSREGKVKIKAALETGRVESNFRNLNYGDADSRGWRQERASLYKNPTNVRASIKRFYNEADQHYKRGDSSGNLAANVQRPAAQYRGRYAQYSREAEKLYRSGGGGGGGSRKSTSAPPSGDNRQALLRDYLARRRDPGALLDLAKGLKEDKASSTPSRPERVGNRSSSGRENPWKAAKSAGASVSSGRRPGAITSAGNVSDHSESQPGQMARDFVGKDMDGIARRVAKSLGIKNYKPGSIVNVKRGKYRYQLIYGTSDHKDHVHLGRKKT